jgi:membrane-associated phospholipid phosphatase
LSLFLFVRLAHEVMEQELKRFDTTLSLAVYSLRTPELTRLMLFITSLGAFWLVIAAIALTLFFLWRRYYRETVFLVVLLAVGGILNIVLKDLFQVPRPDMAPLLDMSSYSFPSGHAMTSFVFYGVLPIFVYRFTHRVGLTIVVGILSTLLIFLIGFSRVYLGVHYPSDVVAGWIAGFWWLVTALVIDRTLVLFKLYQARPASEPAPTRSGE